MEKLPLTMTYHPKKGGLYLIGNGTDVHDKDGGQQLMFPSKETIATLWAKHTSFRLISFKERTNLDVPSYGIWVQVEKGTIHAERQAFCDELLTLCGLVETPVK